MRSGSKITDEKYPDTLQYLQKAIKNKYNLRNFYTVSNYLMR